MSKQLTSIQGVKKRNGFMVYGLVDKSFNQFVKNELFISPVAKIPEHDQRINEMAEYAQVLTDEITIEANGWKPIPNVFNIVASEDPWSVSDRMSVEQKKYMKFIAYKDVEGQLAVHETFHNAALFITGGERLLKIVLPWVDSVELTVFEKNIEEDVEEGLPLTYLKFPFAEYSTHFKRKEQFDTKESMQQSKLATNEKFDNRQVEEFGNMKMVTKIEKKKILGISYYFARFKR